MLVSALGPSGPDGLYRSGLESALAALRSRREGVTALLDSVLGDPGVDWSTEREDAAARCASKGRGGGGKDGKRSAGSCKRLMNFLFNEVGEAL